MAANRTREDHYNQKNHVSVASFEHIPYTYLTGEGSILFVMPKHSIIIHVLIIEEEATSAGAKVIIIVDGNTVVNNAPLDANGLITPPQLLNLHQELGGDVIFKEGSNAPTSGEFTFVIMYIEHEMHNGEYTNFSET